MIEKVSQLVEQVATGASRRQFLGWLGGGALALAAAVGGVLLLRPVAQAGRRVCWLSSQVIACRGLPLGAACLAGNGRPRRCVSDGNIQVAPGVYDCNACRSKGAMGHPGR